MTVRRKAPVRSIRPLDYGMKPKQVRVRKKAPKKVEPISVRPPDFGMKKRPVKVKKKSPIGDKKLRRGFTSDITPDELERIKELRSKQLINKELRIKRGPKKAPRRRPLKSLKLDTPRRRVRRKTPTLMQLFAKSRRS